MSDSTKNVFTSTGILAAIASSLCCIAPLLGFLSGVTGIASSFSWVEPARPYLIALSVIALSLAFWQAYKPRKADDCGCEINKTTKFYQTKLFLWVITFFSISMFAFPYYSGVFYKSEVNKTNNFTPANLTNATLSIEGMTCVGCEEHIVQSLIQKEGVIEASADYKKGKAFIVYDKTVVSIDDLSKTIKEKTGYLVTNKEINTLK